MSASNFVCQKVQLAIQAYLKTKTFALIPSTQIYSGIQNIYAESASNDDPTRLQPSIDCVCQQAGVGDNTTMSGNWIAQAEIQVKASAHDSTQDDFLAMVGVVYDCFVTDTIANDLSSALADFTAFMVTPKLQSWLIADGFWVAHFAFDVHCAGSDIS